ncbi:hypothetical protein DBR17_17810 [Sphingomonas sp. HMWF008]|nr:hypothetical protein DBR17_17810 [Sphingomonas sp. HMWF008]
MQDRKARATARLNDGKVLRIRRALSGAPPRSGLQRKLAAQYDVSEVTISAVARGVIYKHLPHVGDPALFNDLGQSTTLAETA